MAAVESSRAAIANSEKKRTKYNRGAVSILLIMRLFQAPVENRRDMKMLGENKDGFKLHCALIVAQDGVKKTDAPIKAWLEGKAGLAKRLGQGELPREGARK